MAAAFTIVRLSPFDSLVNKYISEGHKNLEEDLNWLTGRLAVAPELIGDHVPELKHLALPIFKTRCKDSCHGIGASGGWRIYYAINKSAKKVFLLFLHHKREYENPGRKFLLQKLERAFGINPD